MASACDHDGRPKRRAWAPPARGSEPPLAALAFRGNARTRRRASMGHEQRARVAAGIGPATRRARSAAVRPMKLPPRPRRGGRAAPCQALFNGGVHLDTRRTGRTDQCYYGFEKSQSSISTLSSSGVESSSSRAVLAVFKIGWPRLLKDVFAKTP